MRSSPKAVRIAYTVVNACIALTVLLYLWAVSQTDSQNVKPPSIIRHGREQLHDKQAIIRLQECMACLAFLRRIGTIDTPSRKP